MSQPLDRLVADNLDIWTSATQRKSGAGRGGGKRISLYGIERLRALILDLAVRGKLVPQDAGDEPAVELLKRIAKTRISIQQKRKPANGAKRQASQTDLPVGWELVRVNDLANPQAGFAFKSKGFNEIGAGLPLIRIRDVGQPFTGTFYSGEYRDEFVVNAGDYLISMDGEFRVATWENGAALLNQRVTRLQFFGEELEQSFVAIALQLALTKLQGIKAYTTVDHLSGKQIAEALIPLPPLAEQRRIVAKVDELMALCDALERESADAMAAHTHLVEELLATLVNSTDAVDLAANWARLECHFDTLFTTEASIVTLKQTILDLAVRGKLVEQDVADGAASDLLKRIVASNAKRVSAGSAKKIRSQSNSLTGLVPFDVPPSWVWTTLDRIAYKLTDGAHHTPTYTNDGVPFLSVKDMSSGTLDFSDTRFISAEQHADLYRRCDPEAGDLLITKVGTTGVPVIVDTDQPFSLFVSVALVKAPWDLISVEYLRLLVDSPFVRKQSAEGTQGIGNKNLVLRTIGAFQIPLPPLAEQQRIVTKVDALLALCDALKARLTVAAQTRCHLADAIVERAAA